MTLELYKEIIELIEAQYDSRIDLVLEGKLIGEVSEEKRKICDKLNRSCMYDPRRPDVGYTSKAMTEKSLEIADKLKRISAEDFLINPYVLEWIDELVGDGVMITNLPPLEDN